MTREELAQAVVLLTELSERQAARYRGAEGYPPTYCTIEVRWLHDRQIGRIAYHAPNFGGQRWINSLAEAQALAG